MDFLYSYRIMRGIPGCVSKWPRVSEIQSERVISVSIGQYYLGLQRRVLGFLVF